MKQNPITIGFDDASFSLRNKSIKTTELIGVICQGVRMVNTVRKTITIDGDDATDTLIELINLNKKHVQFILTDTITFAGFNIYDIKEVYEKTEKPIIAITDREIDLDSVKRALVKKFPKTYKIKFKKIINAGNLYETEIKTAGGLSKINFHSMGMETSQVQLLLSKICIDSKLPECVRMAHIIGKLF
ncbi:MAG: DUF99 family protein [Promethearchaeota archaeon]|nr:MAG: DUF99 family protein [Candidatus Lokiarchaeota archaeon]